MNFTKSPQFEAKKFEDGLNALGQAAAVADSGEEHVHISYLRGECCKVWFQHSWELSFMNRDCSATKKLYDTLR